MTDKKDEAVLKDAARRVEAELNKHATGGQMDLDVIELGVSQMITDNAWWALILVEHELVQISNTKAFNPEQLEVINRVCARIRFKSGGVG